ncbi:MAG: hypothetical protein J6A28_04610 [Clostridia bacterium]|nr:hypothetical protein [Clostridia bacterium]
MKQSKLIFTYDEQEALCSNGYAEALTKAVILLDGKLSRKDFLFIINLHKTAKALLEQKQEAEGEEENEI